MLHWSGSFPIEETMRGMAKLAERGLIHFGGVSNLDVDELEPADRVQRIACDQVLYHLGDRGIVIDKNLVDLPLDQPRLRSHVEIHAA